eukprot:4458997-Heterocapsa_arctica.AAC.1
MALLAGLASVDVEHDRTLAWVALRGIERQIREPSARCSLRPRRAAHLLHPKLEALLDASSFIAQIFISQHIGLTPWAGYAHSECELPGRGVP